MSTDPISAPQLAYGYAFSLLSIFIALVFKAMIRNKLKSIFSNIAVLIVAGIIVFACMELLVRTYQLVVYRIPFFWSIKPFDDPELGWKGKKIFGDPKTNKFKIFIVGDSYTHGLGVKRKSLYYTVLQKELNAEIFVYSAIGYGTLQEYLVIDRYFDEIKPNLILLQVCNNDFIDNSWILERMSFQTNYSAGVRPFFNKGRIEYRFPRLLGHYRALLFTHSRFLLYLQERLIRLKYLLAEKGMLSYSRKIIAEKGMEFEPFQESVQVTETLIKKIKARVGETPVIAFAVDAIEPYLSQFREIFRKARIDFIDEIPNAIMREETGGRKLRSEDHTHWNDQGHHLAGQTLATTLRQLGYFQEADIK